MELEREEAEKVLVAHMGDFKEALYTLLVS